MSLGEGGPLWKRMETCTVGEEVTVMRTCQWCHKPSEVTVPREDFERWMAGAKVQDAFPYLTADVREQLISGTHPACWDEMWGGDDDGQA